MNRWLKYALLGLAWFAAVFLLALVILTYIRRTEPPPLAVDEVALSPACSAPKQNPCLKIDCNRPVKGYIA